MIVLSAGTREEGRMEITVGTPVTFTPAFRKSHPGVPRGTFTVTAIEAAETSAGPSTTRKVYTLQDVNGNIRRGVVKSGLKIVVKSLTQRSA
jgi:hypothetical protein